MKKLDLLNEVPEVLRSELRNDSNKLFSQAGDSSSVKSIWLSIPDELETEVTLWEPEPRDVTVFNFLCKLANTIKVKGYLNHLLKNSQGCSFVTIKEIASLCLSLNLIELEPEISYK